ASGARAEARGAPRTGACTRPRARFAHRVDRPPGRARLGGGGRAQEPSPGGSASGARERGGRRSRRHLGGRALVAHSRAASASRPARLNEPRRALVEDQFDRTPPRVNRQGVEVVREEWRVLDRWWTEEPVARRYFEVVLESGQNVVVFRDEERCADPGGGWFSQRGA